VLLDEWRGFHPYTTWSTTTFHNAATLLAEAGHTGPVTRLGLLRAYATRHGAGPFVTEDQALSACLPEPHNRTNPWQQAFRAGYPDLVALRYALAVAGATDALALSHLDSLASLADRPWIIATAYHYAGDPRDLDGYALHRGSLIDALLPCPAPDLAYQERLTSLLQTCAPCYQPCPRDAASFCAFLAEQTGLPIALRSHGATARQKRSSLWVGGPGDLPRPDVAVEPRGAARAAIALSGNGG
jgi:adenylosuccinate synthase